MFFLISIPHPFLFSFEQNLRSLYLVELPSQQYELVTISPENIKMDKRNYFDTSLEKV